MNSLNVFRTSTWMPSTVISSGQHASTTITGLNGDAEELVTTAVTASPTKVSLDPIARPRLLSTRSRRSLWATAQPAVSVKGVAATRGYAEEPAATPGLSREPPFAGGGAGDAADAPPAAVSAKPPSAIARVELTIDSLRNYELSRPIPVIVESLGERNFVAEVPDLNISTSASNPSDILITLKDRVAQVYDELRIKKNLDREQARQLRVLETYISKSRRSWLDRR